ncbi:MAG TPA: hypothetical protein VIH92_14400 [Solirubrobacteraceae bacterium]
MRRRLERRFWIGVALIAVVAGATAAAVMAAQPAATHARRHSSHSRHSDKTDLLAVAASYLGATPAQVRSELQSGKSLAEIADTTSGKSAPGLIQTLEAAAKKKLHAAAARLSEKITAKVDEHVDGDGSPAVHAATGYLGLSVSQLRQDVRSGKTLAQVANSTSGKSEAGLIGAIVAARKAALAADVSAGKITHAHESAELPKLVRHVTARVQGTRHAGAHKHHHSKSAG